MLLIKKVFLYDPASGTQRETDLLIENGKFTRIEPDLSEKISGISAGSPSSLHVLNGKGLCAGQYKSGR